MYWKITYGGLDTGGFISSSLYIVLSSKGTLHARGFIGSSLHIIVSPNGAQRKSAQISIISGTKPINYTFITLICTLLSLKITCDTMKWVY